MDLQMQLIHDGHALSYESPELAHIPKWASFNNLGYAVTVDPVIFVYNKAYLKPDQVPKSYAQITDILAKNADTYRGRIAIGNPDRGGVPLLFGIEGLKIDPKYWDEFAEIGKLKPNFITGSSDVIESVSSGENIISFNQTGAYVLPYMEQNPDLDMVLPSDYTLGNSRVMFIAKSSPHPNATKLLLDYLLSKRGQTILMTKSKMYPIREDVDGPYTAKALADQLGPALHPIALNEDLLKNLAPDTRGPFIERFEHLVAGKN
jgi:iron(III) transport system substrate-binding protein